MTQTAAAVTPYQQTYDEARAFEDNAWGTASGHAWDRLECIAGEYQRGDIDEARMRELVADTRHEIGLGPA